MEPFSRTVAQGVLLITGTLCSGLLLGALVVACIEGSKFARWVLGGLLGLVALGVVAVILWSVYSLVVGG